jgi:hypothetical protein
MYNGGNYGISKVKNWGIMGIKREKLSRTAHVASFPSVLMFNVNRIACFTQDNSLAYPNVIF